MAKDANGEEEGTTPVHYSSADCPSLLPHLNHHTPQCFQPRYNVTHPSLASVSGVCNCNYPNVFNSPSMGSLHPVSMLCPDGTNHGRLQGNTTGAKKSP